ncbi:MAG: hypothetical protein A3H51_00675 [Candidatus Spechtbacteria bacterium RIFCSPLOWO2_02_FULL_38_8]|uniref:Diadenosine tetraphosphate hydrolase n=1 Tax=Candidatus Spechtbacteria bacterium RIFCSPLOWO2_02_FULL_38_8 TaxID=1802164 RepID=A0A1G2HK05_9BACT|nr:MAG: hypothetical protein A3H51_00675 [Candidatus Spechtbacteria bacterium RIFCSPLOWO2_02_FULL_38_8]
MKKLFPNETIVITNNFDVHQDWAVPIPAFFIIAAKRKIRSISEFTPEEAEEFINLIIKLRKGMEEILNIKDVYFFQNEDTESNFHLWIFPRHEWMENFGRKIQSVRPIMEYAQENMANEEIFQEVKASVSKMKEYMGGFVK